MEAMLSTQEEFYKQLVKAEANFRKSPRERIKESYLETRLENLEQLWNDFRQGHKEIIVKIDKVQKEKESYFTSEKYDTFYESYVAYKSMLKETLSLILKKKTSTDVENSSASNTNICEVKLPRIQLPTFAGKYNEWQTFYDMFISLIHNNKSLSDVQKLHYLKGSLSGEPEALIRNFATTDLNYTEAWKQLTKRYDNKKYNCNAILKTFFSQKPIHNDSPASIKLLLDTTSSCLKGLSNLGVDVNTWDIIVVYFVVSKLDVESRKQWEYTQNCASDELPTWSKLVEFLESRFRSLEMIESGKHNAIAHVCNNSRHTPKPKSFHTAYQSDNKSKDPICALCKGVHYIYNCKQFGQQTVTERQNFVQKTGLCFNCLSNTHSVSRCRQMKSCRRCGKRHHSLLHFEREDFQGNTNNTNNIEHKAEKQIQPFNTTQETKVIANFAKGEPHRYNVLLATAVVKTASRDGSKYMIRALLDQGSQASFITETTVQLLGLKRKPINGLVSGLGSSHTKIYYETSLVIESHCNSDHKIHVNAYILSSLASLLPTNNFDTPGWIEHENFTLADPGFGTPSKIDILLGAEVYGEVILTGIIKDPQGNLIAQNTILGWILSGRIAQDSVDERREVTSMHVNIREDDLLKQFWEIENEPNSLEKKLTETELYCEEFYNKTTKRNEDGRFVVKLPFADEDPKCQYGKTREIALKRLLFLEKRLSKNHTLYTEYRNVMQEYLFLNHMSPVDSKDINNPKAVYLPHHAVIREDKETTKVRVVFNASSKGMNNISLNDDLLIGPKLQQDLRHILLRWRKHRICIVADLVKMYRQVRVSDEDTDFQRILWRNGPNEPIKDYKLLTLTFGTACAPYLAVKTLQRLAEIEHLKYPIASAITKRDYYIDDLMTGCDNFEEAAQIYNEMNNLMNSGGFQLQKWSSNSDTFLKYIDKNKHRSNQYIPIKSDNMVKVLGICWNRNTDNFEYTINLPEPKMPITKRQVLSDIARLYDPIGWIAPIVINAKIFIQKLWKAKLEWDQELTTDLVTEWLQFRKELIEVKNIIIPRWLNYSNDCKTELHVFSDASQVAYAATVYIRIIKEGQIYVKLVSSKTKVAPIDKESSIPRLELCGALLATRLLHEVSLVMNIPKEDLFAWTDSTVVLAWLRGPACRWATFVSNRVSEILTMLDYSQWGYVKTAMNPADCASRGLKSTELHNHPLWWTGPSWLSKPIIEVEKLLDIDTQEEKRVRTMTIYNTENEEQFIWVKYSNLDKMLRVISFCRRFLNLLLPKNKRENLPKYITIDEINQTLRMCIKQAQNLEFRQEIKQLEKQEKISKKSGLHYLCPFLDESGIIRVGGRIQHANVSYDIKHPMIIPAKSYLTKLLVSDAHVKTMHGGPQLMLNFLRTRYWIVRAKEQVKKHYRKCVVCLRYAKTSNQLMGQLPDVRLKPSRPFKSAGVDYAGPINIRFSPGRGSKSYKAYICLFVCMVTRAIHLEVVTDLSAKGFIAAFRRFVSRRGHCQDLYSDNGTNFVGADKKLTEMFNNARSELPNEISRLLTFENTKWHFIPPHAPNFGGLWEAGVRSVKTHLRKVIGDSTLTYEELSTVLTQVEACLNSRPLSVLCDDVDDPLPLTPGHFLVGEPLLNVIDIDYSDKKCTGLERWHLTQKMVSDFWKRWSKEYLLTLANRYKWNKKNPEPQVNDVVVLRDEFLPAAKWLLGKIVKKHPGPDNITRVVTIKCKNGYVKRPLNKVCVITK